MCRGDALILHPGNSSSVRPGSGLLADDLVARLEGNHLGGWGCSSTRRPGSSTPGGWHLTLELSNVANLPITVYRDEIGQISFLEMTSRPRTPTVPKASFEVPGPTGPTPSRYFENFRR